MGIDCVFWIRLPEDDKEGKTAVAQFEKDVQEGKYPGAYPSFKSMPEEIQKDQLSKKEYEKEQEARYFEYTKQPATEEKVLWYRKEIDPFYADDEKVVVKQVRRGWDCRYPIFAYSRLQIDNGYVTIHDGCRRHLNVDYQATMLKYLEGLVPGAQGSAIVLGDNEYIDENHMVVKL